MSKFDKFCEAILSGFITIAGYTVQFFFSNPVTMITITLLLIGWYMVDTWFEFMNGASLF